MPSLDLMNMLPVSSCRFVPDWGDEMSGQGSGRIRVKNLRPTLWRARISCTSMTHAEALHALALVGAMGGSRDTFYVWKPSAAFPAADPKGTLLGAAAVTILDLGADNKSMRLQGVPAGYRLTIGDFLSFDYGGGPSRALHQVVVSRVAFASGVMPFFQVHPHIRPGAASGAVVTLLRPSAEMMLVPGSYDPEETHATGSLTFQAIQVI